MPHPDPNQRREPDAADHRMRREGVRDVTEVDVGASAGGILGDHAVDEGVACEEGDEVVAEFGGVGDCWPEAGVEEAGEAAGFGGVAVAFGVEVVAVEADGEAGEDVGVGGGDDEEGFEGDALVVC